MEYVAKKRIYNLIFFCSLLALACIMIFSCTTGAARISFGESVRILTGRLPLINLLMPSDTLDKTHQMIVLDIRMPRAFLAAFTGAGLSVVGAAFQGMFKNSMADPYVLGISNGAAFGATIAIVLGLESMLWGIGLITLTAFIGAILTTLLVYYIARTGNRLPAASLLLTGIAVGLMMYSGITILMVFNRTRIENIVMWMMGSFSAAGWKQNALLCPFIFAGIVVVCMFSKDLNAMSTGEDTARSLGIEVETVKKVLLAVSAVIVAACVSTSGIIGFVGLIIPHMIRILTGPDHRTVLPFSAVGGAVFLVVCDALARNLIPPVEMPVGAITSLFGAPFFIYLLIKNKKQVL